jgi:hypothetical protein
LNNNAVIGSNNNTGRISRNAIGIINGCASSFYSTNCCVGCTILLIVGNTCGIGSTSVDGKKSDVIFSTPKIFIGFLEIGY